MISNSYSPSPGSGQLQSYSQPNTSNYGNYGYTGPSQPGVQNSPGQILQQSGSYNGYPMGNTQAYTAPNYNATPGFDTGADLTHLGYLPPSNVNTGQPVTPTYGNYLGSAGGTGGSSIGGGSTGGNSPYSIQNLIQMQMDQNNQARQQNQANWDSSKNYLLGLPGQYAGQASTQGAQSLTGQLSANPLSLSPAIVQQMKNEAGNQISAQGDNQFNQVKRAMSADGQTDNSSMAAALEAQGRQNMGAQQTQNTAIDIAAAKQRPIDLANAAGVAQRQSGQDIGVAQNAGNSIMSNLPQVKPDDYSGLLALTNQMQNQQFQNQMLANQSQAAALKTPMAYNPIGGSYSQNGGGGSGAGFSFQSPFTAQSGGYQNIPGGGGFAAAMPNQGGFQNASPWFPGGNGNAMNSPVGGGGLQPSGQDNGN